MYLALAAQKGNSALYLTGATSEKVLMTRVTAHYKASGRRLDMGRGCLRFKTVEELPLDVIGDMIASNSVERRILRSEAALKAREK